MNRISKLLSIVIFMSAGALAQPPEFPKPQKEHQFLKQFTGKWTSHSKSVATEGQPEMECSGSMNSRMLGGFWLINRMQGDMAGTTFNAIQTIGYDPAKKKYVGTWVDSMMNHLWQYEGTVDDTGKKLSLTAKGPNFMSGGAETDFRDSYEFKSPDLIVATSEMKTEDGTWVTFMTGELKRQQP
ncbi:DUF1579 domain-containing protein [Roseiconus nitratireducens]|uniref:DUF1579 domain-containing protein n=1 Tax=Roseiconus nitratireducens TaxID=2605748 RepID=A0A5M6D1E9_9BACT|nr:DUF1579 domain-containing protein [Roseiconus nitratireducens]KAA5541327.1 DUF1579 domain-containing protein [Roseiconus nitratireducens]